MKTAQESLKEDSGVTDEESVEVIETKKYFHEILGLIPEKSSSSEERY